MRKFGDDQMGKGKKKSENKVICRYTKKSFGREHF